MRPRFWQFAAEPPAQLEEIYKSFLHDDAMLAAFIAARPRVVSFHFGIPEPDRVQALRDANIVLIASVTSLAEAKLAESAGMDAVVAQGYEAEGIEVRSILMRTMTGSARCHSRGYWRNGCGFR